MALTREPGQRKPTTKAGPQARIATGSPSHTPEQIDRFYAGLEASELREKQERQRAKLEESRRQISAAAIRDGLNDLKPGAIPARWWWLTSDAKWEKFQNDPWAQGYELLRRIPDLHDSLAGSILGPHYSPLPPERDPAFRPWPTLSRGEQERFKFCFDADLGKLGFHVGGGVWAGNKAIIFNCLWPGERAIAFVKDALECPAPLAVGADLVLVPKHNHTTATAEPYDSYIRSKLSFESWKPIDEAKPEWIRLPMPEKFIDQVGRERPLSDREILKAFETFIKKPPRDFRVYRAIIRRQGGRLDHPRPRTLAFGFVSHDYTRLLGCKLSKIAAWIAGFEAAHLRRLGFPGNQTTREKVFKDLEYARGSLVKLLQNAAST